jgi:hypothetical protein
MQAREMKSLLKERKAGTLTEDRQAQLNKMMVGTPTVQIDMGKPASPGERTDIAAGRASLDALNNLKALFDNPKTRSGPFVGRIDPTIGLFGATTFEQEQFMAATKAFQNAIIKEITGAQMSEQEAARIMAQVPAVTDPPERWLAKWEQSKKNLEMLQKRRLEILKQSGLRVPTGNQNVTMPMPQVKSDADFDNLPSGTRFVDPNGDVRRKP